MDIFHVYISLFDASGGLSAKKGSESHQNLVPRLARSIRRALRLCVDWDVFSMRLIKTDGEDANKDIVVKAIDYLIKHCGTSNVNVPSGKSIDLEELKETIKVRIIWIYIQVYI